MISNSARTLATTRERLVLLVVLMLVASGCRMYGGYGTEDAHVAQAETTVANFAQQIGQAEADLAALNAAAASTPALAPHAALYADLVAHHTALAAAQEARLEDVAGGSYRTVSRALGAMVAEQQRVHEQYNRMHYAIQDVVQGTTGGAVISASLYRSVPAYFERIRHGLEQPTMVESLGQ